VSTVDSQILLTADTVYRFLLARLHVDSLLDKKTKKKVLITLNSFTCGASALDEAYKDAIERINGQLDEDRNLATRVLSWMTYAKRLLTTDELCHALAVELDEEELDADNIPNVEDVVSVCAGLVTIDEESKIIRLVHYTTQEYFERIRVEWNPVAQQDIASTCLTYLTLSTFGSGSCASDVEFEGRLKDNPFFDYSARYWAIHTHNVQEVEQVSEIAFIFLQDNASVSSCAQAMSVREYKYNGYSQVFPQLTTGLQLSARFGLYYFVKLLVERDDVEADSKEYDGRTPLSYAAWEGHEAVVKLLDRGP
jgi:Ankyrin repeats (3 copies)